MPLPPLPPRVTLVEVGPRDGLQNEPAAISTEAKIAFVDALSLAGLPVVEVTAFVNPARVPRMADGAAVLAGITRRPGTRYAALVPNERGLDRALAAGVDDVALFAAASEGFSRRNINMGVDEALAHYGTVARRAREAGLRVRGYLSTCFGCPFDGDVAAERVRDLSARMLEEWGVYEVAISDTIGVAHPAQVAALLDVVLATLPASALALHFHDTRGTALANVLVGLCHGVTTFDASAGGLGGCPFAPGATGNLATEDLLYVLDGLGIETGVSLAAVIEASAAVEPQLDHPLPSRVFRAAKGNTGLGLRPEAGSR